MRAILLMLVGLAVIPLSLSCKNSSDNGEISVGNRTIPSVETITFAADDWPFWRGATRDGIATGKSYPTKWTDSENVVWKTDIPGQGHASPTIVGNNIFLATSNKKRKIQSVLCFRRDTGSLRWRKDVHQGSLGKVGHKHSTFASATVACDGKRVFAVFRNDGQIVVTALDLDGKQLWQKRVGGHQSDFGFGSSPVLHKELVIIAADSQTDGFIAALHRKTGEIWWRKLRHESRGYSSPVVAHVAGKDQLLLSGGNQVVSYDPMTGEKFWSVKGCANVTCGTMVWSEDTVFASGGHSGNETIAIRADGSGDVVWRTTKPHFYVPSMLYHNGHLYSATKGIAYCINAETGKVVKKTRLGGSYYASPILAGGHLYFTSRGGKVTVIDPDPAKLQIVAVNQLGDQADATPTACDGKLYFRVAVDFSGERQERLYCIGQ
jgi:outer membrane protein assembly factor BamB